MIAEIFGIDGVVLLVVLLAVLFGSSQIPKLARSLGSAQSEFKKGHAGASETAPAAIASPVAAPVAPPVPAQAVTPTTHPVTAAGEPLVVAPIPGPGAPS